MRLIWYFLYCIKIFISRSNVLLVNLSWNFFPNVLSMKVHEVSRLLGTRDCQMVASQFPEHDMLQIWTPCWLQWTALCRIYWNPFWGYGIWSNALNCSWLSFIAIFGYVHLMLTTSIYCNIVRVEAVLIRWIKIC